MTDLIASALPWLDAMLTHPQNHDLFHRAEEQSVERELSARWKNENRLELLASLARSFGEEVVLRVIDAVIAANCRRDWAETGKKTDRTFNSFKKLLWDPLPAAGFEFSCQQAGAETQFRVTACPLHRLATKLGAEKWLYHLACLTDEPAVTGFNQNIRFSRTQTLMQGHSICDHRYLELDRGVPRTGEPAAPTRSEK